jgi:hypothetical protein
LSRISFGFVLVSPIFDPEVQPLLHGGFNGDGFAGRLPLYECLQITLKLRGILLSL